MYQFPSTNGNQRGWTAALTRTKFGAEVVDVVVRAHGLTTRNDVKAGGTKAQKGWVGLTALTAAADSDDQMELE